MIIWGILAIIGAFGALGMGAIGAAVFWAAVGSGLIAYGIHRNKQRQQQTQQQTVIVNNYTMPPQASAPKAPGMTVRATASVVTTSDGFSVAGVTFQNEDGSSRQDILRAVCAGKKRGQSDVVLEQFDYKGSPAVRVLTPAGCVGNVRRTDLDEVLETMSGPYEAYIEVNSFVNDKGQEIWRADLFVDAE